MHKTYTNQNIILNKNYLLRLKYKFKDKTYFKISNEHRYRMVCLSRYNLKSEDLQN